MSGEIFYRTFSELDEKLDEKVTVFRNNCIRSEPKRRDGDEATRKDKYCSDKDIFKWVVALEGDDVVGMVAVYKRKIAHQGVELLLGGVGKMRVSPDYQRKGIASKLMEIVMDVLNKEGAEVALLCTNTKSFLVDFYRKFGFELLEKQYCYEGKSGKRYEEKEGMLAPIISRRVFDEIVQSDEILDIGVGNW